MKKRLKAPWLKFYGWRKKTLRYSNLSMYKMLVSSSKKWKNETAFDYFGTKITWKKFISKVDRAARAMSAFGVEKGTVVTIISPNTPEAVMAIYAANKLGAIANVVHPLSSEADMKHAVDLTGSRIVFIIDVAYPTLAKILPTTDIEYIIVMSPKDSMSGIIKLGYQVTAGRKVAHIPSRTGQYSFWEFMWKSHGVQENVGVRSKGGDDPAVILYSGGTTGTPKGILLTNKAFNAYILQCPEFVSTIRPGKTILGILPIFHGFGLSLGVHLPLCLGITNVMLPKFDAASFHKTLDKHKPEIIIGVPTLYEAMLKNKKIRKMDMSFLETPVCGGDVLTNKLKDEVDGMLAKAGCKAEILRGYGLTEFLAGACFVPPERMKLGSIGIPIQDVHVKVVEPNTDIELKTGEMGELVITGPNMMQGYLNEEEETNRTLVLHGDGHVWLHTGDLCHVDEEGYIFYDQRLKRLIISSGYNVYPARIEEVINGVDEVLLVTVVGIPDPYRGQVARAFVVLKDGVKPSGGLKRKIMAQCKTNLPKYSLPWEIVFRKALPKTRLNKVAYRELEEDTGGDDTETE